MTRNSGTLTIDDGAIMPFGGSLINEGMIALGGQDSGASLEILFRGASLSGGGQLVLSDSDHNALFGGSADTVLFNIDNSIRGAGQLGAGQLILNNAGSIIADGSHALVIDTGDEVIINSGMLAATGAGGPDHRQWARQQRPAVGQWRQCDLERGCQRYRQRLDQRHGYAGLRCCVEHGHRFCLEGMGS